MIDLRVTNEFSYPESQGLVVTRLAPPPQQARLLSRQRVDSLLAAVVDYPLSLLVAPAGSGKTTALAGFALRSGWPTVWCRMCATDSPALLLSHLAAAFRPVVALEEVKIQAEIFREVAQGESALPLAALDSLVNELAKRLDDETLLVLDDFHFIDQQPELLALIERFILLQPKRLHLLLSTRYEPLIALLPTARARGEVYQVEQCNLAFTTEEAFALFALYEWSLPTESDVAEMTRICRGWPLALQILAKLHTGQLALEIPNYTQVDSRSVCLEILSPLLHDYLLQQVFNAQPTEIQTFLLHSVHLRKLDREICLKLPILAALIPSWQQLERRYLFLELLATGQLSYQPLFRAFLQNLATQRQLDQTVLHQQAIVYYRQQDDFESVVYHLLEINDFLQAAQVLEQVAKDWLNQGRSLTLLRWLDQIPAAYQQRAALLEARAMAKRRLGHFERALAIYEQAEAAYQQQHDLVGQARALRGRAEVYLDTVQPAQAAHLLKRALKLLPASMATERAEILRLQAENWANRGRADIALCLETCAQRLATNNEKTDYWESEFTAITPVDPAPLLLPRMLLRSGRLNESRRQIETDLGLDPQGHAEQALHPTTVLGHREPFLLLALLYALLGNDARALAMSRRGLLAAQQGGSRFTEAIAHMRVGHTYQVIKPLDAAAADRHYRQALEMIEAVGVDRTKAESYMGLALLNGHGGDLGTAEILAQEGLRIAQDAGDEWMSALIWLTLGSTAIVVNDKRAAEWLDQAQQRFTRGHDSYGQALVALWLALLFLLSGKETLMVQQVTKLLGLAKTYGYEGLLTSPTLFGPRDLAMLIPLLLRGRALPEFSAYAQHLLRQAFPSVATDEIVENYHPGYTLRVQMLGTFHVWRGQHEVQSREWQREKARQLLQLLLTYRGQWLQREQICAWLWPDSELDAAERQFKVTLNALNAALEPLRPPRIAPFFIRRQGLAYSFAPSYGCWIDVDEFELRTSMTQSDPDFALRSSQIAVSLYKGDYLAESLYDSWTLEERERLLARYLANATSLANRLLEHGEIQQAIHFCERILRRDHCYEEAYQVLIRAYARSGSRSQAMRSYTRYVQALQQDDMGIDPLPETIELYEQLKRNEKI